MACLAEVLASLAVAPLAASARKAGIRCAVECAMRPPWGQPSQPPAGIQLLEAVLAAASTAAGTQFAKPHQLQAALAAKGRKDLARQVKQVAAARNAPSCAHPEVIRLLIGGIQQLFAWDGDAAPETKDVAFECQAAPMEISEVREVVREVPKIQIETVGKIVEVPQIQRVEKLIEVPQIQVQEVVRHVPVHQVQEVVEEPKAEAPSEEEAKAEAPKVDAPKAGAAKEDAAKAFEDSMDAVIALLQKKDEEKNNK